MTIERSSSSSSGGSSGGIGFLGLLTVVFITLKLTDVIDWSWVWVLAPLWMGFALVLGILGIIGIVAGALMWQGRRK